VGKLACLPVLSAAFAGCEALRAEQPVDGIRSSLLPGAKRPATTIWSPARDFERPVH